MQIAVIFWLLSTLIVTHKCGNSRLGTVLLETDKIISRSLKAPDETTSETVVQNLRIYVKSLRLLREQQDKGMNKRSTRLTEALINHGRPLFLKYNLETMAKTLKVELDWNSQDVDAAVVLYKEAERLRDEIQRQYKRHVAKF